jgi:hypothetical protein
VAPNVVPPQAAAPLLGNGAPITGALQVSGLVVIETARLFVGTVDWQAQS